MNCLTHAGGETLERHGSVYHDPRSGLVLMTWPCPRAGDGGVDTLQVTPGEARRLATLLLGAAEKLEPSS